MQVSGLEVTVQEREMRSAGSLGLWDGTLNHDVMCPGCGRKDRPKPTVWPQRPEHFKKIGGQGSYWLFLWREGFGTRLSSQSREET